MIQLCINDTCRIPGRHDTGCDDEQCGGCLKALAADGLRLCWHHTNRLGPDAVEAATLWTELGLALIGQSDGTGRARNPQPGLSINLPAVEHRTTIRQTLVGWTTHIADRRGLTLPCRPGPWELTPLPDGVQGPRNRRRTRTIDHSTIRLGRYVADHAQWLAATELAGDVSTELHHLVTRGRSLRQASGTRIVRIGPCPHKHETDNELTACDGTLRALLRQEASLFPSAVTCDANEDHTWASTQWMKLGRLLEGTNK